MSNMVKDLGAGAPVPILGNDVTATLTWKSTTGGKKGLSGKAAKLKQIDLDIQAVIYQGRDPKDLCYHGNKDPLNNGSVTIGADSGSGGVMGGIMRLGRGGGDKPQVEEISLHLNTLPPWVDGMVILVSAFEEGVNITDAESVELRLTDGQQEIYFKPTITDAGNTCLMARLTRQGTGWMATQVNRMVTAHSKSSMLAAAANA